MASLAAGGSVVNHRPWVGSAYAKGVGGQRLLIAGFSHWGSYTDRQEDDDFTNYVFEQWVLRGQIAFFNKIQSYFGFDDPITFWNRVAFANTLPSSVEADEKYSSGTKAQCESVHVRVRTILHELSPASDKALVFTRKGWNAWPPFDGNFADEWLQVPCSEPIAFGTYQRRDGLKTLAYGLRHPQFARGDQMTAAVAAVMKHCPAEQ